MIWRLPDTYHSAGHGRGTATLKFYEGRDILGGPVHPKTHRHRVATAREVPMIFHAREERALARIEVGLTRSDPGLAAKFERFNSLTSQIMPCEKGQGRPRRKEGKLAALILVSLMMTVCLWAAITGARSQRGSGACAM